MKKIYLIDGEEVTREEFFSEMEECAAFEALYYVDDDAAGKSVVDGDVLNAFAIDIFNEAIDCLIKTSKTIINGIKFLIKKEK